MQLNLFIFFRPSFTTVDAEYYSARRPPYVDTAPMPITSHSMAFLMGYYYHVVCQRQDECPLPFYFPPVSYLTLEYFEKAVKNENFPDAPCVRQKLEYGPVVFDIREMVATFFLLWRSINSTVGRHKWKEWDNNMTEARQMELEKFEKDERGNDTRCKMRCVLFCGSRSRMFLQKFLSLHASASFMRRSAFPFQGQTASCPIAARRYGMLRSSILSVLVK
jgi:hypothetical protein